MRCIPHEEFHTIDRFKGPIGISFYFGDKKDFTPYLTSSLSPSGGARTYLKSGYFLVHNEYHGSNIMKSLNPSTLTFYRAHCFIWFLAQHLRCWCLCDDILLYQIPFAKISSCIFWLISCLKGCQLYKSKNWLSLRATLNIHVRTSLSIFSQFTQ